MHKVTTTGISTGSNLGYWPPIFAPSFPIDDNGVENPFDRSLLGIAHTDPVDDLHPVGVPSDAVEELHFRISEVEIYIPELLGPTSYPRHSDAINSPYWTRLFPSSGEEENLQFWPGIHIYESAAPIVHLEVSIGYPQNFGALDNSFNDYGGLGIYPVPAAGAILPLCGGIGTSYSDIPYYFIDACISFNGLEFPYVLVNFEVAATGPYASTTFTTNGNWKMPDGSSLMISPTDNFIDILGWGKFRLFAVYTSPGSPFPLAGDCSIRASKWFPYNDGVSGPAWDVNTGQRLRAPAFN